MNKNCIFAISLCLITFLIIGCDESSTEENIDSARDSDSQSDSSDTGTNDSATSSGGGCIEEETATADSESEDTASDTTADSASENEGTDDTSATDTETFACPADMVASAMPNDTDAPVKFCIDKYEASRTDAAADSHGSDDSMAMSVPGVLPWYVNPMSQAALITFQNACIAAGKHLCTANEWESTCSGTAHTIYVFGNDFDPEICNTVATYCDDYCEENGISEEDCNTSISSCGYYCGDGSVGNECFQVTPTGEFSGCITESGAFDVNGNLWEIVASDNSAGFEVRGGAYNCANPATRLQCTYAATWNELNAGFRCCK
ncbi:MAG: hypothetical protein JXR76_26235 [Deltaproteobacteria bacterium]|nr:hypothetical protein [Deltaproteobacteria bacterium]